MAARRQFVLLVLAALTVAGQSAWAQGSAAAPLPPRTFPEFAGVWVLDETAGTGNLRLSPRIPRQLTIAIDPRTVTLAYELRLMPSDRLEQSVSETYRLDGTETPVLYGRRGVFTLVADALVFTARDTRGGRTNVVSDAYSVRGDVLTLHRQISSVDVASGTILTMQNPINNTRHTFVYRRQARP